MVKFPDHDKGVDLIRKVVEAGVTFIDTADIYGPHSNEELIREALYPYPKDLVIAAKGGSSPVGRNTPTWAPSPTSTACVRRHT